jgi:hypothetical protein
MKVVHSLPKTFTTSDVIIGMGDSGKEQRGAIKAALTRAVENNVLQIVELGRGRKPNTYEKLSQVGKNNLDE